MWLGGDFNLPDIDWTNHQITGHQYPIRINNRFMEVVQDLGLEQVVDFPTRKEAFLDLFLTNRPTLVNRCEPLPGISDHDTIIYINSDVIAKRQKPIKRKIFLWSKANNNSIEEEAKLFTNKFNTDHNTTSDIECMWKDFKDGVTHIIDTHVPSKMSSTRFNQPWITRELKRLSRKKQRSFRKAKSTKSKTDWERYHRLKKASRNLCKDTYNNYIKDIVSPDLRSNPKKCWSFIKSKKSDNSGVAPLKNQDGLVYSDSATKANILNNQFSSVFNKNEDTATIPSKGSSPF